MPPRSFFVDTSCIVAALCAWHAHHVRAVTEIERRLGAHQQLTTAAHALVESYAVLTRLPSPHRLSPGDTLALLEQNFFDSARIVALDGNGYRTLLRRAGEIGVSGGRTYDSLIAECARKSKAPVLLTFNAEHFAGLDAFSIRVVVPTAELRQ